MRNVRYTTAQFSDVVDDEGRKVLAFTIRTTDGTDELHASKMAEKNGTSMMEELVRFSVVSYEIEDTAMQLILVGGAAESDRPTAKTILVDHVKGFPGWTKWSTKARNLVVGAWRKLSTIEDGELADFFASATDV